MLSWKDFGKAHMWLYRKSGGRIGARMGSIDVALVESIGRKSGLPRCVPIACYPYRDSIVVSASSSGKESHPVWYLNMQANPQVTVRQGRDYYHAIAEDVPDEERAALWKTIIANNKHQGEYLEKAQRKIPLVWLRRVQ
ncbi:Deazaflavin-dependent nitroreductase [Halioglobus japonicus]|nr:Deazaflavin-dependent nitroreductase [Halioglobus japonicus]